MAYDPDFDLKYTEGDDDEWITEDGYCTQCSGSGEGMYDGSTCSKCKGNGQ